MASIVRESLARTDDARSLLRDLFRSAADMLPDLEQQVLRVHVHPMSNPRSNPQSLTCWTISTRASSPIPAPACNLSLARWRRRNSELGSMSKSRRSGGLMTSVQCHCSPPFARPGKLGSWPGSWSPSPPSPSSSCRCRAPAPIRPLSSPDPIAGLDPKPEACKPPSSRLGTGKKSPGILKFGWLGKLFLVWQFTGRGGIPVIQYLESLVLALLCLREFASLQRRKNRAGTRSATESRHHVLWFPATVDRGSRITPR